MLKLFTFILISSFSTLSFANDNCTDTLGENQNSIESTRVVSNFLKLPENIQAVRLTGSLSNPPADISTLGNEVVVQTTEEGMFEISIRTPNLSSIEIKISSPTSINVQGDSLALTSSDGKQLSITRSESVGRYQYQGSFMFLVKIVDKAGNELSAYVMAAF